MKGDKDNYTQSFVLACEQMQAVLQIKTIKTYPTEKIDKERHIKTCQNIQRDIRKA